MASLRVYEDICSLKEVLMEEIQEEIPDLILISVDVSTDHGLSQMWRRTSTLIALAMGLDEKDILDFMYRWCTVENAKGRHAVFRSIICADHYGDV
jgi:hypothetical protein